VLSINLGAAARRYQSGVLDATEFHDVVPVKAVAGFAERRIVDGEDHAGSDSFAEGDRFGTLGPRRTEGECEDVDAVGGVPVAVAGVKDCGLSRCADQNSHVSDLLEFGEDHRVVTADPCDRYVNQLMFLAGCGGGPFTAEFVESFCDRGFCKEQGVRIPFEQRRNAIQVGVVEVLVRDDNDVQIAL